MSTEDQNPIPPETQHERWLKYGGNVVLVSVIVIALAALVIYISESSKIPRKLQRVDTTAGGLYSLKPQTLAVIQHNPQKIAIISLYTKAKQTESDVDQSTTENSGIPPVDKPAMVSDLLDEYRQQGSNITTETIDPDSNPGKVEDLINDVMKNYGGEVDKYKKFTDSVPGKYDGMIKLANSEVDKLTAAYSESHTDEVDPSFIQAFLTVKELPDMLKQGKKEYSKALAMKVPDYKRVTDSVSENMTGLSELLGKVIDGFNHDKDDKTTPQPLREYMALSIPRYAELKKQADDLVAAEKGLGELKLDTLRDALKQKNPILVRGKDKWQVIPYEKVWKTDVRSRGTGSVRPQFAGEQMITTAILALNQHDKPKVCFVRAGGPPAADFGGRLSSVADRLRDYNFDVSEKDLTGTYAMQAMQQQQQPAPEPSDAEIEDAVWVVDVEPSQANPMMGGPPPSIAEKVGEHLEKGHHWADGKKVDGGSAFVLFARPQGPSMPLDGLESALGPWGIKVRTDAVAVHPAVKSEGKNDKSLARSAPYIPFVFTYTEWGDHLITNPIQSLMGILIFTTPIEVTPVNGVSATRLIPVPGAPSYPECWGLTDFASLQSNDDAGPKFNKDTDIRAPLFAGAAAEKGGARLVCMGSGLSLYGATGQTMLGGTIIDVRDEDLAEQKQIYAPQFPGDAEFFMNSLFWLSHQETMIAISPSAMNISRIGEIKPVALKFWHIGVLLIGLPGLVLVAGAFAYFSRQD